MLGPSAAHRATPFGLQDDPEWSELLDAVQLAHEIGQWPEAQREVTLPHAGHAGRTVQVRAQPAEGVTYAAKLEKSEALLDWRQSATVLDRQIRAFNPWPIAETRFAGESLRILRARIAQPPGNEAAPGTLLGLAEDGLRVACGEGVLAVVELQRAGKRPVSARDFANAVRLDGTRFGA